MPDRSNTPVTFSREEIAEIRVMLTSWDKPPVCPRCEGELSVEEPEVEELKGHVYLKCLSCHRTAFVSREPPHRKFDLYG
jgi:transposase-like protein